MNIISLAKEKVAKQGLLKTLSRGFFRGLRTILLTRFHPVYFIFKYIKGYSIVCVNDFKMYLDLRNDSGISKDLFIYKKREHISTEYLINSGILKEGDTALDIGANIGYYALLESRLVGNSGLVYAIEPVSRNFKNLKKNIELNNISNIETYNMAVGNRDGEAKIHVGEKGNWSSLIENTAHRYTAHETVPLTSIDSFLQDKKIPSLVRMDVEGYEFAVLEGMEKTLNDANIKLFIEIHPTILTPDQMHKMFDLLSRKGFQNATIIFDPRLRSLTRRGKSRYLVKVLSQKIEREEDRLPTKPIDMSLEQLRELSLKKKRHIHALLRKTV